MDDETTPDVVLIAPRVGEILDRSDFDQHSPARHQLDTLGEDWGEGFFVQEEPVLVERDPVSGAIVRTTPLSEAPWLFEKDEEAEVVEGMVAPSPLPASDREKLAAILAIRLFNWYKNQPPNPSAYNPVYDGIPRTPFGDKNNLSPTHDMKLYLATPGEVFEWIKHVVGARVQIVNSRAGHRGWRPDSAENFQLRLSRTPIIQ